MKKKSSQIEKSSPKEVFTAKNTHQKLQATKPFRFFSFLFFDVMLKHSSFPRQHRAFVKKPYLPFGDRHGLDAATMERHEDELDLESVKRSLLALNKERSVGSWEVGSVFLLV